MRELYIGLMSGTSVDGIDAVLVDFSEKKPKLLETHYTPYSESLRQQILSLCHPGENEIERLGALDITLGRAFADSANELLAKLTLDAKEIKAIGSHGQNIRHHPNDPLRFTIQIGDPNVIAAETGITTVADFRRKDLAYGGQGAPLVPAFHYEVLASAEKDRIIVNIGGIANITLLRKQEPNPILGFDTGPGNALLDSWIGLHQNEKHDKRGAWGSKGKIEASLLNNMLSDLYFHRPPPKSTGREYFNLAWLKKYLAKEPQTLKTVDVQATLVELTAITILDAIRKHLTQGEILVCGGGAHNEYLMSRLKVLGKNDFVIETTKKEGLDPDWLEATAFAWLAKQTMNHQPGNLPSVTGASQKAVLGGVYFAK